MTDELMSLSITQLAPLIRGGEVSPVQLTQAALERANLYDETLNAFISRYDEDALTKAKTAENEIHNGNYRGKLHGIPLGVKDNLFIRGKRTTMGSKIHKNFVPDHSAEVIDRLEEGGAVVLGKTNLHEYALGVTTENPHFGICRNPWNLDKTPGGSSGGSAAAVASRMTSAAIGSDTSGSIRIPAGACGLVGLKPTYGRVSKYGCFPEAWTLDHVGPIAGTVTDSAIMLDAISGHDCKDPASLALPATQTYESLSPEVGNLVVGVEEDFFFDSVDDEIARLVSHGIEELRALGVTVKSVKIPTLRNSVYALTIIDTSETTTVHAFSLRSRPADYGEDVRFLLECGALPSAVDYLQAQQIRMKLKREFEEVFNEVDALIAPTLPIRTPNIGERFSNINGATSDTAESLMRLVGPANLLGLPSLTVPCGHLEGMPVGMQLIGRYLGEQEILNLGVAFESTQWPVDRGPTAYLRKSNVTRTSN